MIRAYLLGDRRAWADQAHVALQHVPELRKLIERELLDRQRGDQDHRQGQTKKDERNGDVEEALCRELRLVRWRGRKGEERDSFELLYLQAREPVLEEVHRHASADAQLLAQQEN